MRVAVLSALPLLNPRRSAGPRAHLLWGSHAQPSADATRRSPTFLSLRAQLMFCQLKTSVAPLRSLRLSRGVSKEMRRRGSQSRFLTRFPQSGLAACCRSLPLSGGSGSGRGLESESSYAVRRRSPWPPRAACAAAMAGSGAPGMSSKAPSANLRRRERPLRSAAPRMPASSFAGNPRLRRAARTWSLPSATTCYDTPWPLALRRQQRQQHNQGQNQQRHGCPLAKEVN